jgi:hypothetical protein
MTGNTAGHEPGRHRPHFVEACYSAGPEREILRALDARYPITTAPVNVCSLEDVLRVAGHPEPGSTKLYDRSGYNQ